MVKNTNVYSLAASGNNIFATAGYLYDPYGVFLSTNNGTSWTQTSLNNLSVYRLVISGNNILAGMEQYGIYSSTNNGINWTLTSLSDRRVYSFAINGNNVFAGTYYYGLYLSTNNGTSWTQTSLNNRDVRSLAINGNNIFAGVSDSLPRGVYVSTNNGTSWTQTSLNNRVVWSLAVNGNNVFAGTWDFGVYVSTNNGTNWTQTSLNSGRVISLAVYGNSVFAGTEFGVHVSNNNGVSWTQRNEGLITSTFYTNDFYISNNYIFIGTGRNVWRRPLSELVGIKPISNEIPNHFSLSQNYPNPFNPTTNIKFSLPNSSFVKLIVTDILGREVAVLVNEKLNVGTYQADWNAVNYPSGVYFYKLVASDYTETKKMVLVK